MGEPLAWRALRAFGEAMRRKLDGAVGTRVLER